MANELPDLGDGRRLLSLFWTPLTAVGARDASGRANFQISLSNLGASIVPARPRLLCVLYNSNFTHDLVGSSRTFTVCPLAEDQVELLPRLGFVSGRDHDKLAGLEVGRTPEGDPVLPDALGWLQCRVLDAFDLGDATAFLAAVMASKSLREATPMVWANVRHGLPETWLQEWEAKVAKDIERSARTMRWL